MGTCIRSEVPLKRQVNRVLWIPPGAVSMGLSGGDLVGGWYFLDEMADPEGPYITENQAIQAYEAYCEKMDKPTAFALGEKPKKAKKGKKKKSKK